MANYTRQTQKFRSVPKVINSETIEFPVLLIGAQVRTYVDTEVVVLTSSAQSINPPAGTEFADIYCQGTTAGTDFCRFYHGADVPTATQGVKLKDHEVLQSADPATFTAINGSGSGVCTLFIEYYKYI